MIIGTLRLRLFLRGAHSLKEKRRVVRSLKDHLSNKFRVAVAEVDHQDVWQTAELGVATVGSESRHVQSVLTKIVSYTRHFGGVELVAQEQETYGG
ncbi:MAG: DUF503 domain-containing protein [Planctomycetota bacterium]|jgi:uncharacterized protein YlxP (DUF503 family)